MEEREYQRCTCCVLDTSDEKIEFDANGKCNRCNEYESRILPDWNHGKGHEAELQNLVNAIRTSGKGKKYDCLIGLSGGLDSSFLLHKAVKEWGLHPYVLHIDAGWDLPVATENIKKVTDGLGVELHVQTMDWNEMKELQLAWFRTGLYNLDAPQDHAFIAQVDRYAQKVGVKYILNGYNIQTEVIADPSSWGKGTGGPTGDAVFMKDVIRKYCRIPIRKYTFTNGFKHKFFLPFVLGVKTVTPLNLVPFTRQEMIDTLVREYGYTPYGQKHFEDLLTKFLEGWWVPTRFGHDIRIAQLSSLVITGELPREEALEILAKPPVTEEEAKAMFKEVSAKLGITEAELRHYHEMPMSTERFRTTRAIRKAAIRVYEKLGLEKRIRK